MRTFTFQNDRGVRRSVTAESVALARTMLPWACRPVGGALDLSPDSWMLVASEPARKSQG